MWVSSKYTYIASLLGLPPTPLHPTPLGHHRALSWASCATQQLPTSCLFYKWQCAYASTTLLIHLTPRLPPCHMSVLCICISIPALQIGSSVPFFSIPCVCACVEKVKNEKWKRNVSCQSGFPGSLAGKESFCNTGNPGSIPESGRSPGSRIGYQLQFS